MESKDGEAIDLEGEEEIDIESSGNSSENEFDTIVGFMEEIIMSDEFSSIQNGFCERNCGIFEADGENKPEYMDIFNSYTRLIESTIDKLMLERMPNFKMARFEAMIAERPDEISGEIFEMLSSMGDFVEFKDMMVNFKRQSSKSQRIDLSLTGVHLG